MKTADKPQNDVVEALEERMDALESILKAMKIRQKTDVTIRDDFAILKGDMSMKFEKVWETIASMRGQTAANARYKQDKPFELQLPPTVELSPKEQQLFLAWRWTPQQIQKYADAKALYSSVDKHADAGSRQPASTAVDTKEEERHS